MYIFHKQFNSCKKKKKFLLKKWKKSIMWVQPPHKIGMKIKKVMITENIKLKKFLQEN